MSTSPVPTMRPRNARFPLFDSCRGLAALSVLFYHVGMIGGGNADGPLRAVGGSLGVGVQIFFAISGFLLYRPFANARLNGLPRPDVRSYARRRVLRIVPAYWVALTGLGIFAGWAIFNSDFWRYYGFLQIYDPNTLNGGMAVAWTLCIEASFYALLPIYSRFVERSRIGAAAEIWLLVALGAFSALVRIVFGLMHGYEWPVVIAIPGTFLWFVPGMLLAVWSVSTTNDPNHPVRRHIFAQRHGTRSWLIAGVTFAALATLVSVDAPRFVTDVFVLPLLAFFVLAPAVTESKPELSLRTLPQAMLGSRVLVWLGIVSYAVYLYHATFVAWLEDHGAARIFPPNHWIGLALATLILTLPVAAASWYLIERPAMRLKGLSLPHLRTAFFGRPGTAPSRAGGA